MLRLLKPIPLQFSSFVSPLALVLQVSTTIFHNLTQTFICTEKNEL